MLLYYFHLLGRLPRLVGHLYGHPCDLKHVTKSHRKVDMITGINSARESIIRNQLMNVNRSDMKICGQNDEIRILGNIPKME